MLIDSVIVNNGSLVRYTFIVPYKFAPNILSTNFHEKSADYPR